MSARRSMGLLVAEYLASRRRLGFALRIEGQLLAAFARYADRIGHRGPVTIELAVRWARLPQSASPLYWSRRLGVVRRFTKYRLLLDAATEVPPPRLLGPAFRRSSPHIYSEDETATLLRACRQLGPRGGLRPRTYATLFGLLACSGLRISEALRLRRDHIDLVGGVLSIVETKFRKSRLVPIHASTVRALRLYAEHRDRRHAEASTDAFFITERGTSLKYWRTIMTFTALRRAVGWTGERAPRIHDLRHTFAVRRLLHWYEQGIDVEQKIAALATYLGHSKVTDTYWYLTAVPALLAAASARAERDARLSQRRQP
jgi:integrase